MLNNTRLNSSSFIRVERDLSESCDFANIVIEIVLRQVGIQRNSTIFIIVLTMIFIFLYKQRALGSLQRRRRGSVHLHQAAVPPRSTDVDKDDHAYVGRILEFHV